MQVGRSGTAGLAVAIVVISASAGCGSTDKASSPSSTSPASTSSSAVTGPPSGKPTDYGFLLIKSNDVGGGLTAPQSPMLNPNNAPGVAQLFANGDSSRRLWDTIVVAPDPSAAAAELAATQGSYNGKVSGSWQPLAVGANGVTISGTSPDNSQAMMVLVFTEGKALVTLEFDNPPTEPVDPAVALDIGRKQDAAIKAGLAG
ncbi:hypothetical protein A5753_14405 [Mycobacterium sp. 852002-51971_SCH5477799-a]|uniref:hypothetical protein n=1 Tax=Mycobacterium sp. 852002-51971_SCH5477799-a TaxID=1834106 RepID=UPI0007FFD0EB|nr:hypothetical protein [Mycobacterium sp. 852002-51971_SCH5477799-a]OBF62945.1 hypothetical protein A5753_14405 [Mycobacterium sp. 852002-51971_SCH5477799-a]